MMMRNEEKSSSVVVIEKNDWIVLRGIKPLIQRTRFIWFVLFPTYCSSYPGVHLFSYFAFNPIVFFWKRFYLSSSQVHTHTQIVLFRDDSRRKRTS